MAALRPGGSALDHIDPPPVPQLEFMTWFLSLRGQTNKQKRFIFPYIFKISSEGAICKGKGFMTEVLFFIRTSP